jgi:ABC-type branched-subunit amino acid transport system ATPase component
MIDSLPVATAAPAIAAVELCAGYHGVPVISDVDIEVHPGEVVALFGPNGAGKTTTLLTLAGEIRPSSGHVSFLGDPHPPALHRRARGGLGLLTEDRCVFMNLTARENLRVGRGTIAEALRLFPELEAHLDKRAGLLSGGQQQMLALARILAARPRVILADELSLGLAPLIVRRLLTALREAANDGAAVLVVEQHVRVALQEVDRAYVLTRGRIALSADAAELRDDPDRIAALYLERSVI